MRALSVRDLISEVRPTLALAGPVVVGQLGMMLMNLVDTAMVGRLGPQELAGVGVGGVLFSLVYLLGIGTLMGLDRLVSFAFGAGRPAECRTYLVQGLWVAAGLSLPLTGLLQLVAGELHRLGFEPELVALGADYLRAVSWSMWPALGFIALRQTLQAMNNVKAATALLLGANVVNALANRWLIFGGLGVPAMGVKGAAWATVLSRCLLVLGLALYAWRRGFFPERPSWAPDAGRIREVLRLGLPAAVHFLFEGGVFSLVGLLSARLGTVPGAANQIVLQVASFAFMVPLGLAAAASVRVGQAMGRGDPQGAKRAGWTAVSLGVLCMGLTSAVLVAAGGGIARVFSEDAQVVALAMELLVCVSVFQLFDGAQVTLAGALRGLGDTLSPMAANVVGHWLLGLPVAAYLAYRVGLGSVGLWIGLAAGLGAVSMALLVVWRRRIDRVVLEGPQALPQSRQARAS